MRSLHGVLLSTIVCIFEPCASKIIVIFSPPTFGHTYIHLNMKRSHSGLQVKMHLPNGKENTVRFSGVTDEHVAKKVQSSNTFDNQEHSLHSKDQNAIGHTNGRFTKGNEIRVPLPSATDRNSVLDTVLTAWAILIQRYQRDVFHQFTWGLKDQGNDYAQCISVADIDWASHQTAASLKAKIGNARSAQVTLDETSIFLRDGSPEEVLSKIKSILICH